MKSSSFGKKVLVEIVEVINGSLIVPFIKFAEGQDVGLRHFIINPNESTFEPFKVLLPLKMLAPHVEAPRFVETIDSMEVTDADSSGGSSRGPSVDSGCSKSSNNSPASSNKRNRAKDLELNHSSSDNPIIDVDIEDGEELADLMQDFLNTNTVSENGLKDVFDRKKYSIKEPINPATFFGGIY
jgi:hypothetical protein